MKYVFILFALPLLFPHLLQAQAAPWARAIYEHNGDIIVLANNFSLLSLNKEGKATILQEPDEHLKEIAPVFLQDGDDYAAAFLQKDGSYIFYPKRYDRRKAYTATPKGNRKYLNANPNAFDPIAIWGDEKSLVLELLKDHSEMVIPLPGKPVSAIGQLGNLVVTIEPDNQPGTLKNYKITGKDMKNMSPLNMGGQVAVFFPGDRDRDIIAFLQRNGTQMDSMFYNYRYEKVKVKLPKPGIYRVAAAHSFANIILVNENQEYWLFKGDEMASERTPFFTRLILPGNQKIITAGFLSDPYLASFYLVGADNKAYYRLYREDTYTPIDLAALRKLQTSTIAGTQPTNTPPVPVKTLSLAPVPDLNLSQQSNEVVRDYYAAVFPAFSDEDRTRWTDYADLNNDGKKDMIISYNRAPYFDVLFGDGKGNFPQKARVKYGPGKGLLVKAADLNKDNKTDLLICHPADSTLTLFTQTATYTFKGQKLTAEKSDYFELTDYNADKHIDIVLDGAILLNNGSGKFVPYQTDKTKINEQGFFVGEGIAPSSLGTMADLNGDGTLDFINITGSYKGDRMTLYGGIGIKLMPSASKLSQAKTNTYQRSFTVVANENMHSIGAGDFDGNGKVDLVVSYQDVSKVSFFMNKGNGENFEQKDLNASAGVPFKIEVFDFDKDGRVEAAINLNLKPQLFGMDKGGNLVQKYQSSLDTDISISTANGSFADLNGDGLMDYIALNDHKAFAGSEFDCGAERCFSVNSFLGNKNSNSFAFTERRMPPPVVTYTTVKGDDEDNKTGSKTSGTGTPSGTQTTPTKNYSKGVANFKGRGERLTNLVIEIEAHVSYETKKDKAALGFKYHNIVDAKGIRFRYPVNSSKWFPFSSGDYVHKCTGSSGVEYICATIGGAVFILDNPDIY